MLYQRCWCVSSAWFLFDFAAQFMEFLRILSLFLLLLHMTYFFDLSFHFAFHAVDMLPSPFIVELPLRIGFSLAIVCKFSLPDWTTYKKAIRIDKLDFLPFQNSNEIWKDILHTIYFLEENSCHRFNGTTKKTERKVLVYFAVEYWKFAKFSM